MLMLKEYTDFHEWIKYHLANLIGIKTGNFIIISKEPKDIQFAQNKINERYKNETVIFEYYRTKFEPDSIRLELAEHEENINIYFNETPLPKGYCLHCGRHD